MNTSLRFPFVLAALMAIPVLGYEAQPARADVRVRVRGKVDVRVGARVRPHRYRRRLLTRDRHASPPPARAYYVDGGLYWNGGIYIGSRFAAPPPPPPPPPPDYCDCDCEPASGYHACPAPAPYSAPAPYPASPPPPATVAAAPQRRPALPRWGIGVFAGSIAVDERMQGEDLGLLGRLRLTDALLLEGEMAKTEMGQSRTDQRLGGALLYDLSPRSRWSLHLLGGLGVTRAEIEGWQSEQRYGELGAGLTWRASHRVHLAADVRAGARERSDAAPSSDTLKAFAPSTIEEERFTRGRLSAIVYF